MPTLTNLQISPVDLWNRITESKFRIETTYEGQYSSKIHFLDRTFAEKHVDETMSRHRVALIALSLLFGINFDHWKKYLVVSKNDDTTAKKQENRRIEAIKIYQKRLKELMSPSYDQKSWTPAKLWHALTQPDFPIVTKACKAGWSSTIKFHDKTFTVESRDEMLSRQGVAQAAFEGLFGICLEKWKAYKQKGSNNSQTSSRASSVSSLVGNQQKDNTATERMEKVKYYTKRANST